MMLPTAGKMTSNQICRYRALLCVQLRAAQMGYADIAKVVGLSSKWQAQRYTHKGIRLFKDCILDTIV